MSSSAPLEGPLGTAADGTPIVAGMFADPTVCRVGDRYVLAHSSFEYAPGIPIWSSTDLVTWTQVGNALDRVAQLKLQPMTRWLDGSAMAPETGGIAVGSANTGNFAPTIRYHNDRLWLAVTNVSDFFGGPMIFSTDDASGPWSDPVQVPDLPGIDPDLFWDEEGIAHLTVSSYAQGGPHVMTAPVDLASGRLLGEPSPLWHGAGGQAPESPHLFAKDGWMYLLLAEGGTERGHAVTIARSRTLDGPWEGAPSNPILTHRGQDRPVLNVGHADLVEMADGRWAMVFLGVRPRGFSGFHVNGRETFLAAVTWVDGWPVVDEAAFEVPTADHGFVDRFERAVLHPRWVSPGRLPESITQWTASGLMLAEVRGQESEHAFLATRPRDSFWTATLELSTKGSAGLTLRVDERHCAEIFVRDGRVESRIRVGDVERRLLGPESTDGVARLYLNVSPDSGTPLSVGPDVVEVGAIVQGKRVPIDRVDGRYLSVEVAGGWTGRMVGARVEYGAAVLHRFEYAPVAQM